VVVFFKPGTRSALDDLLIGKSDEIGATGVFATNLDGQKLTFLADGDTFIDNETETVDNETETVWNILGQATKGQLAGKKLTPVVHANHFWFSWGAFKPDNKNYQEAS